MEIVAALFIDNIDLRPIPGPSTRIDLTGVQFSAAPGEYPLAWAPHLCVMVRNPVDGADTSALEVLFVKDGETVARNVQPVQIEPGKFGYRLVRAEVTIDEPTTIEARCRLDHGAETIVPFTHLPSLGDNPPTA